MSGSDREAGQTGSGSGLGTVNERKRRGGPPRRGRAAWRWGCALSVLAAGMAVGTGAGVGGSDGAVEPSASWQMAGGADAPVLSAVDAGVAEPADRSMREDATTASGSVFAASSLGPFAEVERALRASSRAVGADLGERGPMPASSGRDRQRRAVDAQVETDVETLAAQRGARIGVAVVDLSDGRTLLSLHADQAFTPASTYKLVVVSSMVDAVAQGRASWDDPLSGRTLRQCVEDTIELSDNDCPVDWLDVYGYAEMEAHAAAIGAARTTFAPSDFLTTPADMATIAQRLHDGDLMDPEDTGWIIGLMREQVYRQGVPVLESDDPGITVADKVGWLDGLNNDVAIVSLPRGDYVFSIFTEDADWDLVADIARTAEAWLSARP